MFEIAHNKDAFFGRVMAELQRYSLPSKSSTLEMREGNYATGALTQVCVVVVVVVVKLLSYESCDNQILV